MNTEDNYYDGDMSDDEYRQRIQRQEESDRFYAAEAEKYRNKKSSSGVYYSPSEDSDSGGMW